LRSRWNTNTEPDRDSGNTDTYPDSFGDSNSANTNPNGDTDTRFTDTYAGNTHPVGLSSGNTYTYTYWNAHPNSDSNTGVNPNAKL
jgi:hypothetical protein